MEGLDLGDLGIFNLALIAKLAWEFESCAEKLWVKVLRSKYGRRGLREPRMYLRSSALWVWRGLASSAEIIKKGACFIIKSGESIKAWEDPWVPYLESFKPTPRFREDSEEVNVVADPFTPGLLCGTSRRFIG